MRAVLQRVKKASVDPHESAVGSIACGLLIFLGVAVGDNEQDLLYLVDKISRLRIFEDEHGKMNNSILDVGKSVLVVSQFTLFADCTKGNRPSFAAAASPDVARGLYEDAISLFQEKGLVVECGVFGADMSVELTNDGPVTIVLDSRERKSV